MNQKTSRLAIWSLVLGILSIIPILGFFLGIVGLIFGIVALVKISERKDTLKGHGLATAGTVLCALGILIFPFITGVLAAIAVPRFAQYHQVAKQSIAQSDMISIATALELFHMDMGRYPTTHEGLAALVEKPGGTSETMAWKGPYKIDHPNADFKDPWGHDYVYLFPGHQNPEFYDLFSRGPNGQGDGSEADDILAPRLDSQ